MKVSPEEELALRVRADAVGVSVPRLLVEAALADGAPGDRRAGGGRGAAGADAGSGAGRGLTAGERQALAEELFAVRRLLVGVANNVNQLARAANVAAAAGAEAAVDFPEQAVPVLAVVRRVTERVEACAQGLDGRG